MFYPCSDNKLLKLQNGPYQGGPCKLIPNSWCFGTTTFIDFVTLLRPQDSARRVPERHGGGVGRRQLDIIPYIFNAVAVLHTFQQLMKKAAHICLRVHRDKCGKCKCYSPVLHNRSPPGFREVVPQQIKLSPQIKSIKNKSVAVRRSCCE